MSDDEVRAAAVEAVRQHLELSDKTRVRTSVKNAIGICATIVVATWTAAWAVSAVLGDIRSGQSRIEQTLSYKVSSAQIRAWAVSLDRANRNVQNKDGTLGLTVPDIPEVKRPGE